MILLIIYYLTLAIWGVIGFFAGPETFHRWFIFTNAALALSGYITSISYAANKFPRFSWMGIFSLFSLCFIIVHFQFPFLLGFYGELSDSMESLPYPELIPQASSLTLASYMAFLIGYLLTKKSKGFVPPMKPVNSLTPQLASRLTYGFSIAATIFLGLMFVIDPTYYLGGYYGNVGGYSLVSGIEHVFLLFKVFLAVSIAMDFYRMRMQYESLNPLAFLLAANKLTLGIVALSTLLWLYVGDRGPVIQMVAMYAGGWSIFFFRVRLPAFLIAAICAAMLMAFIREYRTSERGVTLEERLEKGSYRLEEQQWYDVTGELAGNINVLYIAMSTTDQGNYFWGLFKLNNVIGAVPFASRITSKVMGPYMSGLTSAAYLTAIILGPYSQIGVGTTVVTDIYLDFGLPGCIVLMGLLGMFIAWLENRCITSLSVYTHILFFMYLGFAFYWSRSSYFVSSKEILWAFVLVILAHRVLGRKEMLTSTQIRQRAFKPPYTQ
jgi:hypothetical protein